MLYVQCFYPAQSRKHVCNMLAITSRYYSRDFDKCYNAPVPRLPEVLEVPGVLGRARAGIARTTVSLPQKDSRTEPGKACGRAVDLDGGPLSPAEGEGHGAAGGGEPGSAPAVHRGHLRRAQPAVRGLRGHVLEPELEGAGAGATAGAAQADLPLPRAARPAARRPRARAQHRVVSRRHGLFLRGAQPGRGLHLVPGGRVPRAREEEQEAGVGRQPLQHLPLQVHHQRGDHPPLQGRPCSASQSSGKKSQ
mmetsp:Transcript_47241/g.81226  ORF Transcript_47241/g.81226 Transcript_47241/m.81226 type:complete len:250 (-) Transcript_47241:1050-1799(-)